MPAAVNVSVRRFLAVTATACSFALVGAGLFPAAAEPLGEAPAAAETGQTDTRPDAVSAQVTAKATGHRVEDTSQRSETSQVFSNPDGTWTLESYTLPKFRDAGDGTMEPIGETGVFSDAGEAYTGAGARLEVSNGEKAGSDGTVPLVEMSGTGDASDHTLVLGWEGTLPTPELADGEAVYDAGVEVPVVPATDNPASPTPTAPTDASEVPSTSPAPATESGTAPAEDSSDPTVPETSEAPVPESPAPSETPEAAAPISAPSTEPAGTAEAQVVVQPTRTGFQHNVVLDQAPEGDVVLRFPLTLSKGLEASLNPANSEIRVTDRDGELVFYAPTPLMWDAKTNEASGLPAAETPVQTELMEEDGKQVLVLTAGAEWLRSADREYPVTIDPTWSGVTNGDTYVQSGSSTAQGGSAELRVGTFDGGTTRARSYIKFNTVDLTGKKIVSANVRMNNFYSYSCNAAEIKAQRVTENWTVSTMLWSNMAPATQTGQGANTQSKGYSSSSCPAGSVNFPVTPIAQYWADNPTLNYGLRLISSDETNSYSWKRYRSGNYVDGTHTAEPHLVVTYNSYPGTPSAVSFATGQMTTYGTTKYVKTLKPTFQATVSDPDKGNVKAEFTVADSDGNVGFSQTAGSTVASGAVSTLVSPNNRVNGKTYTVKAWANDGTLRSKNSSATTTFTVDTTAPGTPSVASTAYTDNGWLQAKPASNKFTFSSTASDTAVFQYSKDGGTWTDLAAAGTSPRTAVLDWNPSSAHQLRVRAVDKAGHVSGIRTFTFMNGLAALTSPTAGTTTSDAFRVQAKAPASGTGTVTPAVYWRPAQNPRHRR